MANNENGMFDIQRGSIVSSQNKTVGKINWCLVLGCMENQETITAVRLTDDQSFSKIPSLKVNIDDDIFGKDVNVYANPFAILNLKVDWIGEVRKPVLQQEFYGVASTIMNYFMGFLFKEDDKYTMDMPYLQNPMFTMMMGMVNINDAHQMEINSRIKMSERMKKKEEAKDQERLTKVKKIISGKRNTKDIDITKKFDELGVYKLDTQKRIETIYAAFSSYLCAGERLSIPLAFGIIFENKKPSRMQVSKSSVTKEQFAYILNSDLNDICKTFGISSGSAAILRRKAYAIFTGQKTTKQTSAPNAEIREFISEQIKAGLQKKEIIALVQEKFGVSNFKAKHEYDISIHKQTMYNKPINDKDSKLLNILDTYTFKTLKDHDCVVNLITMHSDKSAMIHDGSFIVDSGDTFIDVLVTIAIEKSINMWKWFEFLYKPEYKKMATWLDTHTIGDISDYYVDDAMPNQSIITSAWFLAKIVAHYACINNEEKLNLAKIISGEAKDLDLIDPYTRVAASNSATVISKSMRTGISNHLNLNFAEILDAAATETCSLVNLTGYDKAKRIISRND